MTKRKKFFFIFCFIIIDAILVVGFLVIRDATSLSKLDNEMSIIYKKDITNDRYNTKLKSNGGYAVVEKTIKDYLDYYAVNIQKLSQMLDDPKLAEMLSYDNYSKDGPNFNESLKYLEDNKKSFNKIVDELLENMNEDNISKRILEKTDDSYYISLYKDIMFSDEMSDELNNINDLLNNVKTDANDIYDTCITVLNYLKVYQGEWTLEDGEIKFKTQDMYDYYTGLVNKVKKDE